MKAHAAPFLPSGSSSAQATRLLSSTATWRRESPAPRANPQPRPSALRPPPPGMRATFFMSTRTSSPDRLDAEVEHHRRRRATPSPEDLEEPGAQALRPLRHERHALTVVGMRKRRGGRHALHVGVLRHRVPAQMQCARYLGSRAPSGFHRPYIIHCAQGRGHLLHPSRAGSPKSPPGKTIRRGYRGIARIPVAVKLGPAGKGEQPFGGPFCLLPRNEPGVGVSEDGHLQDARVAHLRAPEALGHADLAESRGQGRRVSQLRRARRCAKPVHDGARMRRGVSQRVRAPERVVLVPHPGIAPSVGAEEVEVGEGAERRQLQKDPRRHLAYRIPRNERPEAGIVLQHGRLLERGRRG